MVIARLGASVSIGQAQSEMETVAAGLREKRPRDNADRGARAAPLYETVVGDVRHELLVLFGAAGFVLLAACANIANLLLGRSMTRKREIAVRAALGAGRTRLVRQSLTEILELSLSAAIPGLLMATWGIHGILALAPKNLPRLEEISVDGRVFLFSMMISIAAGLVAGIFPALKSSRLENSALKEGLHPSTGKSRRRLHNLLAVSEVALGVMLLVGSGLMVRTFIRLQSVELGFDLNNLLTASVNVMRPGMRLTDGLALYQRLAGKIRTIPGVVYVGMGRVPLISGNSSLFFPDGRDKGVTCGADAPSPDYFRALHARLVEGRLFSDLDRRDAPQVAIVNRTAAERFWPGESAVGRRMGIGSKDSLATVIGVTEDIRMSNLESPPRPFVYIPLAQSHQFVPGTIVIKAQGDPRLLTESVRRALKEIDGRAPLGRVATMDEIFSRLMGRRRFLATLISLFSAIAIVLACVGIYGLVAHAVSVRLHEFGIRTALGARKLDIFRSALGQGLWLIFLGEILGVAGALALNRVMTGMVWGVETTDPATYVAVSIAVAALSLGACWMPARRATRVDPVSALRCE